jgi:hypothetical protein
MLRLLRMFRVLRMHRVHREWPWSVLCPGWDQCLSSCVPHSLGRLSRQTKPIDHGPPHDQPQISARAEIVELSWQEIPAHRRDSAGDSGGDRAVACDMGHGTWDMPEAEFTGVMKNERLIEGGRLATESADGV